LSFRLSLPEEKYSEAQRRGFYDQLLKRVGTLPGVVGAGAVSIVPMSDNSEGKYFEIVGRPPVEKGKKPGGDYRVVTPGYFDAIGISRRRGRDFTAGDNEQSPAVAIGNETFARRLPPKQRTNGQRTIPPGKGRPND